MTRGGVLSFLFDNVQHNWKQEYLLRYSCVLAADLHAQARDDDRILKLPDYVNHTNVRTHNVTSCVSCRNIRKYALHMIPKRQSVKKTF